MKANDIELLSNQDIPESVRSAIAEQILSAPIRAAERNIEIERLRHEKNKFLWSTPLVAAIAGLITLSATFAFEKFTARDNTRNTITLEQVKNELLQSEIRLKQQLEISATENLARLKTDAKEREFQYEIVRSELTNADKSNADRAAVLLFLVQAGVLSTLNENELREMAEQQIEQPNATIVPQLSPSTAYLGGVVGSDDAQHVSGFENSHPIHEFARSVGRLKILASNNVAYGCVAFLVDTNKIATANHCVNEYEHITFELFPNGFTTALARARTPPPDSIRVYEVVKDPPERFHAHDDDGDDGYAILRLERTVDSVFSPLMLDSSTGATNAKLGIIYFRAGQEQLAIWDSPECRALDWQSNLIYHNCDTGIGTSGSPIINIQTGRVVAVHSRRSELGGLAYRIVD